MCSSIQYHSFLLAEREHLINMIQHKVPRPLEPPRPNIESKTRGKGKEKPSSKYQNRPSISIDEQELEEFHRVKDAFKHMQWQFKEMESAYRELCDLRSRISSCSSLSSLDHHKITKKVPHTSQRSKNDTEKKRKLSQDEKLASFAIAPIF